MAENTKPNGGPAFPTVVTNTSSAAIVGLEGEFVPSGSRAEYSGMTLRDYFAAHAPEVPADFYRKSIPRVVDERNGRKTIVTNDQPLSEHMVRWRWHYADLMLAARNQTNTKD